jgi:hypothetical protein
MLIQIFKRWLSIIYEFLLQPWKSLVCLLKTQKYPASRACNLDVPVVKLEHLLYIYKFQDFSSSISRVQIEILGFYIFNILKFKLKF